MKNIRLRWKALWNPDMFHGWGRKSDYFEGWYFKIVNEDESLVMAIIPGISMDKNGQSHSFIQVLDGINRKMDYHRFDIQEFRSSEDKFEVSIGRNYFSANKLKLDLEDLKLDLDFKNTTPWPKMLKAPGIMGWFSFVPFMECNHGVVSMHHVVNGSVLRDGSSIQIKNGIGYIEKDWGSSFPKSWIWMQSNHFKKAKKASLMASCAHIPWLNGYFIGYIVGFYLNDKLYKFATYTGAKMKAILHEDRVFLAFKDSKYRLEINAYKAEGTNLKSPISGEMTGKVNESMQARLETRLFENDDLIFEDSGFNAGLEIAGEVDMLLTDKWRR